MPEKDPTSYALATYLWVSILSAWGGMAKINGNGRAVPTIPGFLSELPSAPW